MYRCKRCESMNTEVVDEIEDYDPEQWGEDYSYDIVECSDCGNVFEVPYEEPSGR